MSEVKGRYGDEEGCLTVVSCVSVRRWRVRERERERGGGGGGGRGKERLTGDGLVLKGGLHGCLQSTPEGTAQ